MPVNDTSLKIVFNSLPSVDDTINAVVMSVIGSTEFNRIERFKTVRVNPGEVAIGATVNETASNYASAFILDYGGGFTIVVDENEVTISIVSGGSFLYFTNCVISSGFADFNYLMSNNTIHIIRFTPRIYTDSAMTFLITEDLDELITEDEENIIL